MWEYRSVVLTGSARSGASSPSWAGLARGPAGPAGRLRGSPPSGRRLLGKPRPRLAGLCRGSTGTCTGSSAMGCCSSSTGWGVSYSQVVEDTLDWRDYLFYALVGAIKIANKFCFGVIKFLRQQMQTSQMMKKDIKVKMD